MALSDRYNESHCVERVTSQEPASIYAILTVSVDPANIGRIERGEAECCAQRILALVG